VRRGAALLTSITRGQQPLGTPVVQDGAIVLHAGRLGQGVGAFVGTLVDNKAWQGVVDYAP